MLCYPLNNNTCVFMSHSHRVSIVWLHWLSWIHIPKLYVQILMMSSMWMDTHLRNESSFCSWPLLLCFVSLLQTGRRSGRQTPTRTSFPKPEQKERVHCHLPAWIQWLTPPPAPAWPSSAMHWLSTHMYRVGKQVLKWLLQISVKEWDNSALLW